MLEASIPAMLHERARLSPDATALTFVNYEVDWAGVAEGVTWSQLYWRTLNVAQQLQACGSAGDRAVILAPQGLDYVAAFLGALQAGQIAVPLSVPLGGVSDERVNSVLHDTSPSVVLTTCAVAGSIAEYVEPKAGDSPPSVIEVDLLDLGSKKASAARGESAADSVYLQYTSGSTRTPAGVMVSYENVMANFEQINAAFFGDYGGVAPPDTTLVSWLPFYHDMGLHVGIIFPLLTGLPAVLMSPVAFLQRPARWMQLLASNSHALSAGPNFAFELAARKTSDDDMAGLDLGNVLSILNGAERVQPETMQRFTERFASFNLQNKVLRPSYGMAEATLYIATRDAGQPPRVVQFDSEKLTEGQAQQWESGGRTALVSYGVPRSPLVRIVDPETCVERPEGRTGEIWVHGGNVAIGYWQKPRESEETFGGKIVSPSAGTPEGPWLRTGDLGFISGGELFIIGRIKDLLIVYGRNHSPDDLEATIQSAAPGRCAAISVPDESTEKLVVIIELKNRAAPTDEALDKFDLVKRKVTSAISNVHGLSVADLVLVEPGSIPITTSGKIRRRDCVQRYLRDEFTRLDGMVRRPHPPVVEAPGARTGSDQGLAQRLRTLRDQQHDLLVDVVCAQVVTVLGNLSPSDIDPDCAFQELGLDSVKAAEMLDRLQTVTELTLPATLAFDHPTPAALATHLRLLVSGSVTAAAPVVAQVVADEPVAVVGMACRFPGGVDSAAALWDLVASGTEVVGGFPADRGWNLADLFDSDPDVAGKTYTRAGAFLADVAGFDAEFFGISAREAQMMDPQQRLLLEVCWEALETARIDPVGLMGSETGVFVGAWSQAYGGGGSDGLEGYALTGLSTSVASGRVAYALGLQGPAITVDTACSSSLVATHLACQSLRSGESALALAGGVTVMTTPAVFTEFARQRGLSVDGRCKAFSASADGTGWGEGAAVLVLERLGDARRNNHPVLAVVAGSAINQDGASNGLTAPSGPAQQRVIRQAAANARIGLGQVDVVEAHGTGTMLGDPIEAGALIATYGACRDPEQPLWLGSIKSNIGHTQAAAGAAGLIKMIEALNRDTMPPTLHIDQPSPHIDWSAGTVRLLTEAMPWPVTDHLKTAAVSSFGISGTNAHLIVQQAPTPSEKPAGTAQLDSTPAAQPAPLPPPLLVWPISARSTQALAAQARRLHQHLSYHPDLELIDVAYSLASTRTQHPYRATISTHRRDADPRDDLLAALDALAKEVPHPRVTRHHSSERRQPGDIVFVFPGQGAQYPGMGLELYRHHRGFAQSLDRCDQALHPLTGWSVCDVLRQDPTAPSLQRADVVQPVLFAIMVSLAELLGSYGIAPDAVIGHSQGEIAAAYIAGVFSLADAAKIVVLRSQALTALSGSGAMASIVLPAEELRARLQPWVGALDIAAINGPSHTVVSGDPVALEQLSDACSRERIHVRPIAVDYASHGRQVEQLRDRLLDELNELTPQPSHLPLYSTVDSARSSQPLDTTEMNADYWYRNLREPVRFYDGIANLLRQGEQVFVELSAHPVAAAPIKDTVAGTPDRPGSAVITMLHRDQSDLDAVGIVLAQLHNHGHSPSWQALYPDANSVALPTYAFQHRSYWVQPTSTTEVSGPAADALWKAIDDDAIDTVAEMLELSDTHSGAALDAVVGALRQWRSDLGVWSAANALRYRVDWDGVVPRTFPPARRRWLILVFPDQADDVWVTGLSARYAEAVEVLTVDPGQLNRNSLSALLTTAFAHAHYDGVVSFMATDERPHRDYPGISVGLLSTLLVAQAHCDVNLGIPLWVITQGAVSVSTEDGPASPRQSAVWGLAQSVCLEHPDQWGGLIDLPHRTTPHDIEELYAILSCPQSEDQLAIRRHGVSARRLIETPLPSARREPARSWKPSGTALVTGATGRLGKHVVGWLAAAGANHLVLLSRNASGQQPSAELEKELNARGVTTTWVSVDVTDRPALAAVLADIRRTHGPIRTVVHAAAVIELNAISAVTAEELCNVYSAKAVGADHLVELLEDEPPETFIFFSSVTGTWGGARHGCYAAGNAHIDALATQLRSNGCCALAAAFGIWADETGGLPQQVLDSSRRIGINQILPKTALAGLQQAIEANDTLITIADVSWDRFVPAFTARRSHPLLTELALPANESATSNSLPTDDADRLRAQLATQTPAQQLDTLTALVASATAAVFAHPDPAALDPDQYFEDLGIDSLTALELRNDLTRSTGLTLSPALIFEHPTVATLATHLAYLLNDTTSWVAPAQSTEVSSAAEGRLWRVLDDDDVGTVTEALGISDAEGEAFLPEFTAPRTPPVLSESASPGDTAVISSSTATANTGFGKLYDEIHQGLDTRGVGDATLFMNYGYVSLDSSDEAVIPVPPVVFSPTSVQLVYELVGSTQLRGRTVADVGCGRGGSTVQLIDAFGAEAIGVDLSPAAIMFCRRMHARTRAVFEVGDAENLPFDDQSLDAVFNLESSHSYPSLTAFLCEVHRVLRDGGWLLHADILRRDQWELVRQELARLRFSLEADRDITRNVLASRDEAAAREVKALGKSDPFMQNFLAVPGTAAYQQMSDGTRQYRILRARRA